MSDHIQLKDLFYSIFHEKYDFDEMISLNAYQESSKETFYLTKNNKFFYHPNQKLMDMHEFIRFVILQHLKIDENVVFSFRKKKNIIDAVIQHNKSHFFFLTDFSNFFQSIIKEDVEKVFKENLDILNPIDVDRYIENLLNIVLIDNKLPIGFSTSPVISNSVMYEFDTRISVFCKSKSIVYTRYADDLIFSSQNNDELLYVADEILKISNELFSGRLVLNDSKSKFLNRSSKIKIMGAVILPNGVITIDKRIKNDLESAIHIYMNKPEEWKGFLKNKFPSSGIQQIAGLLGYVNSIDPDYVQKLRRKYGVLAVDMLLKKNF